MYDFAMQSSIFITDNVVDIKTQWSERNEMGNVMKFIFTFIW